MAHTDTHPHTTSHPLKRYRLPASCAFDAASARTFRSYRASSGRITFPAGCACCFGSQVDPVPEAWPWLAIRPAPTVGLALVLLVLYPISRTVKQVSGQNARPEIEIQRAVVPTRPCRRSWLGMFEEHFPFPSSRTPRRFLFVLLPFSWPLVLRRKRPPLPVKPGCAHHSDPAKQKRDVVVRLGLALAQSYRAMGYKYLWSGAPSQVCKCFQRVLKHSGLAPRSSG